jgi:hypothetical protein
MGKEQIMRIILTARSVALSVAVFVLGLGLTAGPASADEPKPKAEPALAVILSAPDDMKYEDVFKVMEKMKALGVERLRLRTSPKEKEFSAEITAVPTVPAKKVSVIVEALMEGGARKISLEVKK